MIFAGSRLEACGISSSAAAWTPGRWRCWCTRWRTRCARVGPRSGGAGSSVVWLGTYSAGATPRTTTSRTKEKRGDAAAGGRAKKPPSETEDDGDAMDGDSFVRSGETFRTVLAQEKLSTLSVLCPRGGACSRGTRDDVASIALPSPPGRVWTPRGFDATPSAPPPPPRRTPRATSARIRRTTRRRRLWSISSAGSRRRPPAGAGGALAAGQGPRRVRGGAPGDGVGRGRRRVRGAQGRARARAATHHRGRLSRCGWSGTPIGREHARAEPGDERAREDARGRGSGEGWPTRRRGGSPAAPR